MQCHRRSTSSLLDYVCESSDGEWAHHDQESLARGCPQGFELLNPGNPFLYNLRDQDRWGRPQYLAATCDVCIELNDVIRSDMDDYAAEEAVEGPEVPDYHPMQPPRQIDLVQNWETFGGTSEEDMLLEFTMGGEIVRRRYTNEELQLLQEEWAQCRNRNFYYEDQRTFYPHEYLEYLQANPEHESNMREELEEEDRLQREIRLHQWRQLMGDAPYPY